MRLRRLSATMVVVALLAGACTTGGGGSGGDDGTNEARILAESLRIELLDRIDSHLFCTVTDTLQYHSEATSVMQVIPGLLSDNRRLTNQAEVAGADPYAYAEYLREIKSEINSAAREKDEICKDNIKRLRDVMG